jgi:hypothetical protein
MVLPARGITSLSRKGPWLVCAGALRGVWATVGYPRGSFSIKAPLVTIEVYGAVVRFHRFNRSRPQDMVAGLGMSPD